MIIHDGVTINSWKSIADKTVGIEGLSYRFSENEDGVSQRKESLKHSRALPTVDATAIKVRIIIAHNM